jgi:predicted acetyltransferase
VLVSIRDCKRSPKERQWIEKVYGEYLDALADLNTGVFLSLDVAKIQQEELLANWFANDHSHPLLIAQGTQAVGFALVTRPRVPRRGEAPVDYCLSEFFVRQAHRCVGVGRQAAMLIFDRFAGAWEVLEYERNRGSVQFWRRVLAAYTGGEFVERAQDGQIRQRFNSRTRLK